MSKQTFEEWAAKKISELPEVPPPKVQVICGCGTCQEALDAAMRSFEQLAEHHCILWTAQIAAMWANMARAALMHHHPTDFNEVFNEIEMEFATHMAQPDNWKKWTDLEKRVIEAKRKQG